VSDKITPNGEQAAALAAMGDWLSGKDGPRVFRLSGCAGSGKTTIAALFADGLPGSIILAPTNRAAAVLNSKGLSAITIHSAIYQPDPQSLVNDLANAREALKELAEADVDMMGEKPTHQGKTAAWWRKETIRLMEAIDLARSYGRDPHRLTFTLRTETDVDTVDLVVVDEASMVTREVYDDLLVRMPKVGKVLAVGDARQLPPVEPDTPAHMRGGFFATEPMDVQLVEPVRVGSEITDLRRLTTRAYQKPPEGLGGDHDSLARLMTDCTVARDGSVDYLGGGKNGRVARNHLLDADIIICLTNKLRAICNMAKRRLLGIDGPPREGEPLVALFTEGDIVKGEMLRVQEINPEPSNREGRRWTGKAWEAVKRRGWEAHLVRPGGIVVETWIDAQTLRAPYDMTVAWEGTGRATAKDFTAMTRINSSHQGDFAFGYATTCHTAQGGEWPHVLVLDERAAPWLDKRISDQDREDRRRWRYTAITRAQRRIVVKDWFMGRALDRFLLPGDLPTAPAPGSELPPDGLPVEAVK